MRALVLVALLLAPVVGGGVLGPGAVANESLCGQTFGEVPVGIGEPIPLPVPILNGIGYVDVEFHSCSNGGYAIRSNEDNVRATRICSEEVVRVWSVAGDAGKDFVIDWFDPGKDDCP